jgi:hypothetical protein
MQIYASSTALRLNVAYQYGTLDKKMRPHRGNAFQPGIKYATLGQFLLWPVHSSQMGSLQAATLKHRQRQNNCSLSWSPAPLSTGMELARVLRQIRQQQESSQSMYSLDPFHNTRRGNFFLSSVGKNAMRSACVQGAAAIRRSPMQAVFGSLLSH